MCGIRFILCWAVRSHLKCHKSHKGVLSNCKWLSVACVGGPLQNMVDVIGGFSANPWILLSEFGLNFWCTLMLSFISGASERLWTLKILLSAEKMTHMEKTGAFLEVTFYTLDYRRLHFYVIFRPFSFATLAERDVATSWLHTSASRQDKRSSSTSFPGNSVITSMDKSSCRSCFSDGRFPHASLDESGDCLRCPSDTTMRCTYVYRYCRWFMDGFQSLKPSELP